MPGPEAYRVTLIRPNDGNTTQWEGGTRTELFRYPEGARMPSEEGEGEPFAARVSTATVDRDGRFTVFKGYQRTLVLLEGEEGMFLDHGWATQVIAGPLRRANFRGSWITTGAILERAKDFNLIVDPRRARGQADVIRPGREAVVSTLPGDTALFYAHKGETRVTVVGTEDQSWVLHPGESLLIEGVTRLLSGEDSAVKLESDDPAAVMLGVNLLLHPEEAPKPQPLSDKTLTWFHTTYKEPNMYLWQGSVDKPVGPLTQRFHQVVKPLPIRHNPLTQTLSLDLPPTSDKGKQRYAFIGFASDEGVKRNHGRPGAVEGPLHLRRALAGLPLHLQDVELYDAGDIVLSNDETDPDRLLTAQLSLARTVRLLLNEGIFPIVLGGGHETAYGHGLGVLEWVNENHPQSQLGIVNWDAHFDLRPLEDGKGTSGTPFLQLAQHYRQQVRPFQYLTLGVQESANTSLLFETAGDLGVNHVPADRLTEHERTRWMREIDSFIGFNDFIYLTNCLDVFSSAVAPGVSATNPTGLFPHHVFPIFDQIIRSGKVVSMDVAELLPKHDIDDSTAKLAARIIHRLIHVRGRLGKGPPGQARSVIASGVSSLPRGTPVSRDPGIASRGHLADQRNAREFQTLDSRSGDLRVAGMTESEMARGPEGAPFGGRDDLQTKLIHLAHSRGLVDVATLLSRLDARQITRLVRVSDRYLDILERRGFADVAARLMEDGGFSRSDRFLIAASALAGSRRSLERWVSNLKTPGIVGGRTASVLPFPASLFPAAPSAAMVFAH